MSNRIPGRFRIGRFGVLAALAAAVGIAPLEACGTHDASAPDVAEVAAPAPKPAFVAIDHGVHPYARPEYDVGRLDPDKHLANLAVVFKLSPKQLADREALQDALLDPGSPSYHAWLTPEDYAARFGASADDLARTRAWLASQGLTVDATSRLGARLSFSGRVADVERAFRTEMHRYQVGGESHYAMSSAPSVPGDLADVVLAIHNTHDFFKHPIGLHSLHALKPIPNYTSGATVGIAPPDWTALYDVDAVYSPGVGGHTYDGTGITVGIVGIAQIAQSDIDNFRSTFGLGASTITMTPVPGTGAPNGNSGGAGVEAILDVEWSGGIAKGANVNYVATGAGDLNVDDATFYAIEQNIAPILSESWGGCENGESASDADILMTFGSAANLLGITYLASSGDQGAAGCIADTPSVPGLYVNMPAAFPGVTAVGGTEFPTGTIAQGGNGFATGYATSEQTWNESQSPTSAAAGGGGISSIFARPSYQTQTSAPTCAIVGSLPVAETAANMRQIPDVSFSAASGNNPIFIDCTLNAEFSDCSGTGGSPQIFGIGGTSASAPSFAGVVALLNQAAGTRLGNINPLLYSLETSTPSVFHDITKSTNEITCKTGNVGCPAGKKYGYAAATGYDCATGIGSVDVLNLVTAVKSLAPTTTTLVADPTTVSEGTDVELTATVSVPVPNTSAVGGFVTFNFQSYLADGTTPDLSWTIGESAVTTASVDGATALLDVPIPPGLVKSGATFVDVVALYGGDSAHMASKSEKKRITFTPIAFCATPGSVKLAASATQQYTAQGGIGAIRWYIDSDSTCDIDFNGCSSINESTGAFTAGTGQAGYVIVAALDADGAETFADVIVGTPSGTLPIPWIDAGAGTCPVVDAGAPDAGNVGDGGGIVDAGHDSGAIVDAGHDSGTIVDAGHDSGTIVDAGHDSGAIVDAGHDSGTIVDAGHDSGTIVDAGHDSGTIVDAGHDSGAIGDAGHDAGHDAGTTADAGHDAGHATDGGGSADSGGTSGFGDSGNEDASNGEDSGVPGDDDSGIPTGDDSGSAGDDASADEDATVGDDDSGSSALADSGQNANGDASSEADGGTNVGTPSGCSCTTAGRDEPSSGMLGAIALGLGLVVRRRRTRRSR